MRYDKLIILTGAPGTGKTSLLAYLRSLGYSGVDESARAILEEQLKVDGPALPAKSPERFVEAMLERKIEDFESSKESVSPIFFDRGIPDLIAYAVRFGVCPERAKEASRAHLYNKKVFILPVWKEIFVNDSLRKLSFEQSEEFHDSILEAYQHAGYDLIETPRRSIAARADFILKELDLKNVQTS